MVEVRQVRFGFPQRIFLEMPFAVGQDDGEDHGFTFTVWIRKSIGCIGNWLFVSS